MAKLACSNASLDIDTFNTYQVAYVLNNKMYKQANISFDK
jgi:hypothetical protein